MADTFKLFFVCQDCNGTGKVIVNQEEITCKECDGTGEKLQGRIVKDN